MAIVIQTLSDSAQARKDLGDLKTSVLGIQKSSEGLANKFANIGKALVIGGGIYATVAAFTKYSDVLTNLDNRIKVVTNSQKEMNRAFYAITDIAVSTRSQIDGISKLYTRFQLNAKGLGASQQQIAAATKAVAQSMKISGATAAEANSTVTQLSQTLAKTVLNGDEFNSIMENAPYLANQIAKGMGVTVGQLYEMRDAGKLFSRDVLSAILKQTKEINGTFAKTAVTFSDAFTNMGTSLLLLFDSVSDAFLGSSGGGLAEIINGWAVSIANFARNFTFYLLKAKTSAIIFAIDVTSFFTDIWDAILEGPEAIYGLVLKFVDWLKPIARQVYDLFVDYSARIYQGSSVLFFAFVAWLRKSKVTTPIADWLESTNDLIVKKFEALAAKVSKLDFSRIYDVSFQMVKQIWERIKSMDIANLLTDMWDRTKALFNSIPVIDVNKFIPGLDTAKETVKRWAKQVAHWFWWLYDVVIGHSFIPDLVNGVKYWLSTLLGVPLAYLKLFISSASSLFASLNPFKLFGSGLSLLKILATTIVGIVGSLASVAYFADKLPTEGGKFDGLKNAADSMSKAIKDFISSPITKTVDAIGGMFGKTRDYLMRPVESKRQNQFTGAIETTLLKRKLPFDILQIPRDKQAALGVAIGGIGVAALTFLMNGGALRSIVISLFTTGIAAGMARGMDHKLIRDFFLEGVSGALKLLGKGIEVILGTQVSKDPFGFLALAAKFSLLFAAGREYFLGLLKNAAIAPTLAGRAVGDNAALKLGQMSVNRLDTQLKAATAQFNTQIMAAGNDLDAALERLARSIDANGNAIGKANAKRILESGDNANLSGAALRAAQDARLAAARKETLKTELENNGTVNKLKEGLEKATESVTNISGRLKERAAALREGLKNFASGAGGAVGTAVGLEAGNRGVAALEARRREAAAAQLQQLYSRTGQTLSKEEATLKLDSKDFSELNDVGKKIAKDIVLGMDVPIFQKIGLQIGGAMVGQMLGSLAGAGLIAIFSNLGLVWAGVAALAFRVQYYATIWGGAAAMKAVQIASWIAGAVASRAVLMAGMVATWVAGATASLVTLAAWPVILVAAVIAAAVYIWKNWDQIKAKMIEMWNQVWPKIKQAAIDFKNYILDGIKGLPGVMLEAIKKAWKWLTTVERDTSPNNPNGTNGLPNFGMHAAGGPIRGPGTGTSDDILAWLSNGEYVINAEATSKNFALLEAINNGRPLPRFAKGGKAGSAPTASTSVVKVEPFTDGQADRIGNRIGDAAGQRGRLLDAASRTKSDTLRAAAIQVADEWSKYMADQLDLAAFVNAPVTSALAGAGAIEDSEDKKKKRKAAAEKDKKAPDGPTFEDELTQINDTFPKLALSMDDYLKLSVDARKQLLATVEPLVKTLATINKTPAGDPNAFAGRIKYGETVRAQSPGVEQLVNPFRSSFAQLGPRIEQFSLGLDEASFQLLDGKMVESVTKYLDEMSAWSDELTKVGVSTPAIRKKMNDATSSIKQLIELYSKTPLEKIVAAGIDITTDSFNLMKNETRDLLKTIADQIIDLTIKLQDTALNEQDRIAAQTQINVLRTKAGKLTDPVDKAKQAGIDFAQTMKDSFTNGLSNFLKTGKINLLDIASTFTNKLIDTFSQSLMDSLFGGKLFGGKSLNDMFGMIGSSAQTAGTGKGINFGGIVNGLFGKKKKDSPLAGVANTLIDAAPKTGDGIVNSLVEGAPKIGGDIAGALSKTMGAGGAGGGSGLAGLAGAAGSLFGLLIGKLFNEGGHVSGPGTSTSDSIPARLSNGEFVVKAKQVGKYRGLIEAINNDSLPAYAEGGLVGVPMREQSGQILDKAAAANQDAYTKSVVQNDIRIVGDISRQTRKEVYGLIPQIAAGVNAHNKEKGIR